MRPPPKKGKCIRCDDRRTNQRALLVLSVTRAPVSPAPAIPRSPSLVRPITRVAHPTHSFPPSSRAAARQHPCAPHPIPSVCQSVSCGATAVRASTNRGFIWRNTWISLLLIPRLREVRNFLPVLHGATFALASRAGAPFPGAVRGTIPVETPLLSSLLHDWFTPRAGISHSSVLLRR